MFLQRKSKKKIYITKNYDTIFILSKLILIKEKGIPSIMTEICAVVSGKGGVGKSMTTFTLAGLLSGGNNRAITIDFNLGLRGLDLLYKCEQNVVYDLSDILDGKCASYHDALFRYRKNPNLYGIAAPSNPFYHLTFDALYQLMDQLKKDFNYIFLDAPASISGGFVSAMALCDRAIIVTTPDPLSVSGATKIGQYITNSDTDIAHVLINGVNFQSKRGPIMSDFDSIIDSIGYPLIGVLPFSERLYDEVMKGQLPKAKDPYMKAVYNVARRFNGEMVPLLFG